MTTYMGFTKETYKENLAGYQAQHSRSLMDDSWITPKDVLEKLMIDAKYIIDNWDDITRLEGE